MALLSRFTSPNLLKQQRPPQIISDTEESVIALRYHKLPKGIWTNFENRKPGHLNLEQLKGDLIKKLVSTANSSLAYYLMLIRLFLLF